MKLLKISSASFLVLCALVFATPTFGATTTPKAPVKEPVANTTATLIASINIRDAKIISQAGNTINISFNITNGEKAQAGVRYGVKLTSGTAKSQVIVDEYVYPEVLSLSANSTILKNIGYIAPASLGGEYTLSVEAKNESGLTMGTVTLGKIKLASLPNTVQITPGSCSLSIVGDKTNKTYNLAQAVTISPTNQLSIKCSAVNSSTVSISAIPTYETYYLSTYGNIAETTGGDTTPIIFKAGEKKVISLILPKASIPQAYDVRVSLKSGILSSNSVIAHYIISGTSATIQNFSLDKDSYKKGDTAKLSLYSSSSSKASGITLSADITNDNQKACIIPISQALDKTGPLDISAPVVADCINPTATVTLKDANGNILDQKVLSFESPTQPNTPSSKNRNTILIIFGILVVAGVAVYFINLKKKSNEAINQ